MILLHLTWLLNSLHLATPYTYLPKNELSTFPNSHFSYSNHYHASLLDIPFHVLIVYNNLYCSATLIRSRIAITVASCFVEELKNPPLVKVGAQTITGSGQIIPVVDVKLHEYFRYMSRLDNDIAMLVLKEHVRFKNNVKKAILIEPEVALRTGVTIEVSGYGSSTMAQTYVNQLIWTEMTILDKKDCDVAYPNVTTSSNFCAQYVPERHLSDNGGPAVYNRQLVVGMLSYGATNTEDPHVAIFTNISYFHRWITLNTKTFLEKYCVLKPDTSEIRDFHSDSEST